MKLVLDMSLPPAWSKRLGFAGFDAVHWSEIGPPDASDAAIMHGAVSNGRIVVTQDPDFGALLAATRAEGPSVVQLRADDLIDERTADRLALALNQVRQELADGALVSVDLLRTRIRLLPIGR